MKEQFNQFKRVNEMNYVNWSKVKNRCSGKVVHSSGGSSGSIIVVNVVLCCRLSTSQIDWR